MISVCVKKRFFETNPVKAEGDNGGNVLIPLETSRAVKFPLNCNIAQTNSGLSGKGIAIASADGNRLVSVPIISGVDHAPDRPVRVDANKVKMLLIVSNSAQERIASPAASIPMTGLNSWFVDDVNGCVVQFVPS